MDDLEALATATRTDLLAIIAQQRALIAHLHATIARLEATVGELEGRVRTLEERPGPGAPTGMPGHKPPPRAPRPPPKPRRKRARGFGRQRATPTAVVRHALDACPACQIPLVGGWVVRTRQVIETPLPPAEVIEHQFVRRRCPCCRRHWTPRAALGGAVVGQQRFGVDLLSLIVTLREAGRLPVRVIRRYLRLIHGLEVSDGAIVAAQRLVAARGRAEVAAIRAEVRASPVVHADETGWREAGANGYLWTFSTPTAQYFVHGGRARTVVTEALGEPFPGTLVTDFYAAYNHHEGPHQRCWAHLLRDVHEVRSRSPDDRRVQRWAGQVKRVFEDATAMASPDERLRRQWRRRLERRLLAACRPFLAEAGTAAGKLCRRIERFLDQLFVFVADPAVPPTNNRAERSLRHQVTVRKISGGTRSADGTATKVALATLFGTWAVRGLNPFEQCRRLLTTPQT